MHPFFCTVYFHVLIPYCTMGGLLLAACYHTNLYFFRKSSLLGYYSIYLWICFFHIGFDAFFFAVPGRYSKGELVLSDTLLVLSNQFYFIFVAKAFEVSDKSGWLINLLYKASFASLGLFLAVLIFLRLSPGDNLWIGEVINLVIWPATIACGILWIVLLLRKHGNTVNNMIGTGALMLVLFNILALTNALLNHPGPEHINDTFQLDSFTITCIGFFLEITIFSAAVGAGIRRDLAAKLASNEMMISRQQLLLQHELDQQSEVVRSRKAERMHISEDMDDELSNALSALNSYAGDLYGSAADEGDKKILHKIRLQTADVYAQAQAFMQRLHGSTDEFDYDLPAFLSSLTADFKGSSVQVTARADKEEIIKKLDAHQQSYLYLIIKESMSNVLKYAGASKVEISISFRDDECMLQIADNGRGMDAKNSGGIGLQNIRERMSELGGTAEIHSSAAGTAVSAVFNYAESNKAKRT